MYAAYKFILKILKYFNLFVLDCLV